MTKRILIVDDEALIALTAVDMVESLGYEAFEAHSGAEALEILNSGKAVDLLITDQSMPGMSGAELIREARLLNPNLSVMVSTGYWEIGEEFGQDVTYLGKPYSEEELSSKIEAAIG
jgi:CheY-like chemotaxis protein